MSVVGITLPAGSRRSWSCRLHRGRGSGTELTGFGSRSRARGRERTLRSRHEGWPIVTAGTTAGGLVRPKCTALTGDAHTDRAESRVTRVCAGVGFRPVLRMVHRTGLADSLGVRPSIPGPVPTVSLARWSCRHSFRPEPAGPCPDHYAAAGSSHDPTCSSGVGLASAVGGRREQGRGIAGRG